MVRFLIASCMMLFCLPAFARGHEPGSRDEAWARSTESSRKLSYESMTGIVCRRLPALRHVFRTMLRGISKEVAIRVANHRYRGAGCAFKRDVHYLWLCEEEPERLPGGTFSIEYDSIFLRYGGLHYRGVMMRRFVPKGSDLQAIGK